MTDKGTLWFSDIRKSNDRKELVYGFNQIKKRLETLVSDDRKPALEGEIALDDMTRTNGPGGSSRES